MIYDLHNDYPTALARESYGAYIADCRSVQAIATAAIWTSELGDNAISSVADITSALIFADADAPIAIEDLGVFADGEKYKDLDFSKYLYCSLTWNYNNGFAGGALDDGTLTENGKNVIELMNKHGCAVDLAHLNKRSFYQALDRAEYAICSHTGFNAHLRSLDDDRIHALISRGGIIGLCTVKSFTDAYNARDFVRLIDMFVQKYGSDNLAIGTDFNGSTDIPDDISNYNRLYTALTDGFKSLGYTDGDMNKILFANAESVGKKHNTRRKLSH